MTTLGTPIHAGTSFPNTPESDRQTHVLIDVNVRRQNKSEETVRLYATDPGDAISKIRDMSDQEFLALTRVPSK